MQRYFIEGNEFNLNAEQIKHIVKVMRMEKDDEIEVVFNSECFICRIVDIAPFKMEKVRKLENSPELNVDITLLYCLPKGDKLDLVIQKATEIGVKNIILVQSSRCVCKFKKEDFDKKLARFKKIATEASEQSHRLVIPEIKDIIDYKDINKYHFDYAYIAYENEENGTFIKDLKEVTKGQSIGIIIGSEGGFSPQEVEYAIECGYKSVTLGKRILRSETACIYALSVISYLLEDK